MVDNLLNREELINQFLLSQKLLNCKIAKIAGDASFRSYFRVFTPDQKTFIVMDAPPEFEDIRPFCQVDQFLIENHFLAPKIFAADYELGFVLLEDFGDNKLNQVLASSKPGSDANHFEEQIYQSAIDVLVNLHQVSPPLDLKFYDHELLLKEVMLFVDWYLPFVAKKPLTDNQKAEFVGYWQNLFDGLTRPEVLVLRDYHVDNLMLLKSSVNNKNIGLLDFQDAVIGSKAYDLVSLLEDARRDVGIGLQEKMLQYYLDRSKSESKPFLVDYQILSLQRNIKIIGIFSRLSARDNKVSYLSLLPRVFGYVQRRLKDEQLREIRDFLSTFIL